MHHNVITSIGLILSCFVLTRLCSNHEHSDDVKSAISSLIKSEMDYENEKETKVAVGFGSCMDVMIPALKAFKALNLTSAGSTHNHDFIFSLKHFKETFGYFFQRGASAGRYAMEERTFELIFDVVSRLGASVKLGGNAAAMSRRFSRENVSVLLMADVMSEMSQASNVNQLPEDIKISGETKMPEHIHIIFEYEKGDIWGHFEAPRANRFILYKTSGNVQKSSFSRYFQEAVHFQPSVLVVGGFRGLSQAVYSDRKTGLDHLERFLRQVPPDVRIHIELSSFAKFDVLRSVVSKTIPWSDSLGMNEQELPNLRDVLQSEIGDMGTLHKASSIVSESHPSLASILDNVRSVMRLLVGLQSRFGYCHKNSSSFDSGCWAGSIVDRTGRCENFDGVGQCQALTLPRRLVSRIHVHTLPFQVIAIMKRQKHDADKQMLGSGEGKFHLHRWKNSRAAVAKSALTANRHTCGNETVDPVNSMFMFQPHTPQPLSHRYDLPPFAFNPKNAITCWEEGLKDLGLMDLDLELCLAPVPVCRRVNQTVGGGDNVSAAGLVPQV